MEIPQASMRTANPRAALLYSIHAALALGENCYRSTIAIVIPEAVSQCLNQAIVDELTRELMTHGGWQDAQGSWEPRAGVGKSHLVIRLRRS